MHQATRSDGQLDNVRDEKLSVSAAGWGAKIHLVPRKRSEAKLARRSMGVHGSALRPRLQTPFSAACQALMSK